MLGGKDFATLYTMVPFVGMFVDRAIGEERNYLMKHVHTIFYELDWWLRQKDSKEES